MSADSIRLQFESLGRAAAAAGHALAAATSPERRFTPPYFFVGLYAREQREAIEKPNRETMKVIFEQRAEERKTKAWAAKVFEMHNRGVHMPGYCPHCPSNIYYD